MAVDLTIRLGDILTMTGLFGGGIVVVITLRASISMLAQQMRTHDVKIAALDDKINGIASIIAEQARHDERLRFVEQQVRDLQQVRRPA
jgi:hypothetical protein